jgi:aryl-alcohol dehydrogenase-like predicted oxidoreductase
MEYRKLGTTGRQVSVVGIGCWAMGGPLTTWGHVDDNESIAAIQQGLELGINLIDTAPAYGYGHSEEVVGRAIASRRREVVLATKCGFIWREPGGRLERCLRRESVRRECEASLRRLRVDQIDVYQIHAADAATPIGDTMETLLALRSEGKIGAIGVSNFNCQQISDARRAGPVDCVHPELSLLEPQAADELLPYCREYNIGVLTYGSLASGLLTGKFDVSTRLSDVRGRDARFIGEAFRRNLGCVDRLNAIAARRGRTVGQIALRWVLQQEGVTCAVVGAKRGSQVRENAGASEFSLSEADLREIDLLLKPSE